MMQNILYALGFSSKIPKPTGPYSEVGVLPFRLPDANFVKIFYPAAAEVTQNNPKFNTERNAYLKRIKSQFGYNTSWFNFSGSYQYTRPKAVDGLSKFGGAPRFLFYVSTGHTKVGYSFIAPPASASSFPVVVFSHGLGGNADIYSKFCSDVASLGYVVIAVEHEDASGSYAFDAKNNRDIFYDSSYSADYTRRNVVNFRSKFLDKRVKELDKVIDWVYGLDPNSFKSAVEKSVFSLVNKQKIFLSGHSFGSATSAMYSIQGKHRDNIKGMCLLDIWAYPLPTDILHRGISLPVISILSAQFLYSATEFWPSAKLFSNSNTKMSAALEGVTHAQMSDAPWFTRFKYIRERGALEGETTAEASQLDIVEAVKLFFENPDEFSIHKLGKETLLSDISQRKAN
eukprot:maker-scaffold_14-snap-gene-6.48-mRNA-1 protein AED:0.00 eAED:0.00 QI:65/1/1/1/1/1/2/182/399